METEDSKISAFGGSEPESDEVEATKIDLNPSQNRVEGDVLRCTELQQNGFDAEIEEGQLIPETATDKAAPSTSAMLLTCERSFEPMEANEEQICAGELASSSCYAIHNEITTGTHHLDGNIKTGIKRSCIEQHQPSVHIKYCDLPRDSKRKLHELLQQWSEWHERYCSSSYETTGGLESGEDTYFPALRIGVDKKSAVSFWMDNQMRKPEADSLIPVNDDYVPLYDRGFSLGLGSADGTSNLEGGMEVVDASRCFNCGSYNHALRECPKPRNNLAVNNARKLHKTKRNQNPGSRNPSRYYQSSVPGKYEGLRPGVLDSETRELLGLRELDPPPWLQRMREIGYPPAYLESDEEDQPSGITIFADEEDRGEKDHEDGEILETNPGEPRKKMTVLFPGVNAPIPESADKRRWEAGVSKFDPFRDPLQERESDRPESSRRRFQEARSSWEQDSSYTPNSSRGSLRRPRSPGSSVRSSSERDRERERERDSRSSREDSPSFGLYSSYSYPSPTRNERGWERDDRSRQRSRR